MHDVPRDASAVYLEAVERIQDDSKHFMTVPTPVISFAAALLACLFCAQDASVMYLEAVELMEAHSKESMVASTPFHHLCSSSFDMSIVCHRMEVLCIWKQWS